LKKTLIIILSVFIAIGIIQLNADSSQRGEQVQTRIEKGNYIPGELVSASNIKLLPVPFSTNDYAFYQSLKKVSNVVIGRFKTGEKEIILIQDNNVDGQVDMVAHWFIDLDRTDREGEPDKYCTAENFKKLKELIVNGKSEAVMLGGQNITISPNKEAIPEMEKLLKTPSNVTKFKQGLRVKKIDTDERSKEIMLFSYSINTDDGSADLAFDIKFNQVGKSRISPVINYGVYCLKSQDPFAIETVKKLSEGSAKYLPK
jgi:hypothetical protein